MNRSSVSDLFVGDISIGVIGVTRENRLTGIHINKTAREVIERIIVEVGVHRQSSREISGFSGLIIVGIIGVGRDDA